MECGECTACCTMFPIEPIGKPINTHCQYCDNGCSIYNTKPQTCTDYECAYVQSDNIPKELRPDKCGIIFTKKTDTIFSGSLVTGVSVNGAAKQQIGSFNGQGISVILLSVDEDKPHIIPSKDNSPDAVYKEYKEAINGNI